MSDLIRKKLVHFNDPGHAHALTFSCYRQWPLLSRDRSRQWVVDSLASMCQRYRYDCLAYVVMPEHVHIVVIPQMEAYDISDLLGPLKQSVSIKAKHWLLKNDSKWLKKLTFTDGSGRKRFRFWQQGGGYDRNIRKQGTLDKTIGYIHNNPVRRKLVEDALDWRWSSARWYDNGCVGSIFEGTQPPGLQP